MSNRDTDPVRSEVPSLAPPLAVQPVVDTRRFWTRAVNDGASSWMCSLLLHASVLLVLTLFITAPILDAPPSVSLLLDIEVDRLEEQDDSSSEANSTAEFSSPSEELGESQYEFELTEFSILPAAVTGSPETLPGVGQAVLPKIDWLAPFGAQRGGGLQGRGPGMKGQLLAERGGNEKSEAAVQRGLRWLAAHQRKDGSWRFNHIDGPCNGHCRNPGNFASTTAATALALLPFYGAGHTHKSGDHQEVVGRGLYYLGRQMRVNEHGGDLQQGSMYAQGIAAIVLCEAYAMSGDENLREFAQAAVDFIVWAQHPKGGWRYNPGEPGDTTSTAWQLMALKSAQLAGLEVPTSATYRVAAFLDSVETDDGAQYGYQNNQARNSTTSVGLLCRMYLGWRREVEPLARGVKLLDKWGPSPNDMYYNYYATQVMSHYGGPEWSRWNETMRDQLIRDQSRQGHEAGSWFYDEKHSDSGGRLYNTCMAIMTLEVYYRHMPLYAKDVTEAF